jgi:hypothetical protein
LEQEERNNLVQVNASLTTNSSKAWSVVDSSTLLYLLDHICEPQTGLRQVFRKFQRISPFESEEYEKELVGVSLRDGIQEDLLQEKLAREIQQVR